MKSWSGSFRKKGGGGVSSHVAHGVGGGGESVRGRDDRFGLADSQFIFQLTSIEEQGGGSMAKGRILIRLNPFRIIITTWSRQSLLRPDSWPPLARLSCRPSQRRRSRGAGEPPTRSSLRRTCWRRPLGHSDWRPRKGPLEKKNKFDF